MGLLDNLRDRLSGGFGDDYDDDDYYDDEYDDDDYDDEPTGTGLLGNTPRPEAESVAVYTRSGRPVTSEPEGRSQGTTSRRTTVSSSSRSTSYSSRRPSRTRDDYDDGYDDYESSSSSYGQRTSAAPTFNASGQLPPYVLRAEAYEDVQTVVRRVRTNQPVYLVLDDTPADVAQRILDFCFGLSFGIGGEVQPTGGKSFLVLPEGIQVSQAEIDRLANEVR